MNPSDLRRHPRLKHRAKIRVIVPELPNEYVVDLRDFSESGLFLKLAEQVVVAIGDIVEVQTMEFDDAPIQKTKVVRLEPGVGFAVEFLLD